MRTRKLTYSTQNDLPFQTWFVSYTITVVYGAIFVFEFKYLNQTQELEMPKNTSVKVLILGEGHKIWKKNPPHGFDIYLLMSKLRGRFFQIFVALSEYLNFKLVIKESNFVRIVLIWYII